MLNKHRRNFVLEYCVDVDCLGQSINCSIACLELSGIESHVLALLLDETNKGDELLAYPRLGRAPGRSN
jgi:hypothetical protein